MSKPTTAGECFEIRQPRPGKPDRVTVFRVVEFDSKGRVSACVVWDDGHAVEVKAPRWFPAASVGGVVPDPTAPAAPTTPAA